jgi:PAS domain S-box-containing protein
MIKRLFDHLPCAAAVWGNDAMTGSLNHHAKQLLGVADCDLAHAAWISRIEPSDRQRFATSWEQLKVRRDAVCNDYRFLRGDGERIWLRDVSIAYRNGHGDIDAIISTYTDISDLKARPPADNGSGPWGEDAIEGIIGPVIHEIRNNLHAVRLEIDLLLMDFGAAVNSERFFESMDRVNRSLHDLREYLVRREPNFSAVNPSLILHELLGPMTKDLAQQRIKLDLSPPAPLPLAWADTRQLRSALERILDFCRALLDQGGVLKIQTKFSKADAAEYLELILTATSVSSFEVDEDIFRPFLRVNNRGLGLAMALASDLLRRNKGQVHFAKESPSQGRISILLKPCVA